MARKISLAVSTTNGTISVIDYDDVTYKIANQYNGGYGGLKYEKGASNQALTAANDTINLIWSDGRTGVFKYSEIATATIGATNVLATATDLAGVVTAFSPYFFFDGAPITVTVQTDGAINYIDLGGLAVDLFMVNNPSNLTVSEFRNLPHVGHQFLVIPVSSDTLPITRTAIGSVADNKISGGFTPTFPLEGSKGEFMLCFSTEIGSAQFTMVITYMSTLT
jgi:hypothetical protein